ncbi:MAG: hypothetical protein NUV49_03785, partial [Patescibacteria group bacterium]|nr:hypothetical protein [Patescibacteria group bacterium]
KILYNKDTICLSRTGSLSLLFYYDDLREWVDIVNQEARVGSGRRTHYYGERKRQAEERNKETKESKEIEGKRTAQSCSFLIFCHY